MRRIGDYNANIYNWSGTAPGATSPEAEPSARTSRSRPASLSGLGSFTSRGEMPSISASTQGAGLSHQIVAITQQVGERFQLSTTGYQTAMGRLNKRDKSDADSLMTLSRAQQYMAAAKTAYPSETLKSLASLQQSHIYHTAAGELRGAIEMSPADIEHCLQKCRQLGFANCDMQALEVALQLRHGLGITDFSIVSNHKLSHNYVVIHPSTAFPKGAIADSWTGQGLQELNLRTKLKFQHKDQNYTINSNMHAWIEQYGARHFGR